MILDYTLDWEKDVARRDIIGIIDKIVIQTVDQVTVLYQYQTF